MQYAIVLTLMMVEPPSLEYRPNVSNQTASWNVFWGVVRLVLFSCPLTG